MPTCPLCRNNLNINIQSTPNDAIIKVESLDTIENLILDALMRYWRWTAEGCPKEQFYYDPYHDNIKFIEDDVYSFNIQTYDSPMGDTWLCGKFKVNNVSDIQILEQNTINQ